MFVLMLAKNNNLKVPSSCHITDLQCTFWNKIHLIIHSDRGATPVLMVEVAPLW